MSTVKDLLHDYQHVIDELDVVTGGKGVFDVEVDGTMYAESAREQPGDEVVVSELTSGVRVGMSICYDVRFPELYRALARDYMGVGDFLVLNLLFSFVVFVLIVLFVA